MILSKRECPDCKGSGRDAQRGGLCGRCHGEGKSRPTADEEARVIALSHVCRCAGGTGNCDGGCA
jgi:DnaJ-class molecular chaperone